MKFMKRKNICIIMLSLFIIGLILDLIDSCFCIKLFIVDSSYKYYVFAASATVAAISATLLTIIINSLNDEFHGFKIKEIINFDNEYIKIPQVVIIILSYAAFSSFFLVIGWINSIVCLFLIILCMIGCAVLYVWRIVTDTSFCLEITENEINKQLAYNDYKQLMTTIIKLISSYTKLIENKKISSSDLELMLISRVLNSIKNTSEENLNEESLADMKLVIESKIDFLFRIIVEYQGYSNAIEKILPLYMYKDQYYNKARIFESLEKLRYIDNQNAYLLNTINSFAEINKLDIDDNLKITIIYQMFSNVYKNVLLNEKLRNNILSNQISLLVKRNWSEENKTIDHRLIALIYVFRDFVILNEDIGISKQFISSIITGLEISSYDKLLGKHEVTIVSIVYLLLYIFSYEEKETISKEHRETIKSYLNYEVSSINVKKISIQMLVRRNFTDIVKELFNLSNSSKLIELGIEYFPNKVTVKTPNWRKETLIDFALCNYFIDFYGIFNIPYKSIEDWDNVVDKKVYYRRILEKITVNNELKKEYEDDLSNIAKWIGKKYSSITKIHLKDVKDFVNKELRVEVKQELYSKADEFISPTVKKLNEVLKNTLESGEVLYGYDSSLIIEDDVKLNYIQLDIYKTMSEDGQTQIVKSFLWNFEGLFNEIIDQNAEVVELGFDLNSVKKLLGIIKSKNLNLRNYTYVDDLAFHREVTSEDVFDELVTEISKIDHLKMPGIRDHIFTNIHGIRFNLLFTSFDMINYNEEECIKLLNSYKVADGLYKILDAYFDETQAIEYIKTTHSKVKLGFKYSISICNDDIFKINISL